MAKPATSARPAGLRLDSLGKPEQRLAWRKMSQPKNLNTTNHMERRAGVPFISPCERAAPYNTRNVQKGQGD
jgi:hypothetical protein